MIDLSELFVDRRTKWEKVRDWLWLGLILLVIGTIFVAGIIHIIGKF